MSTPKSKQKPAPTQFVDTAIKLFTFTAEQCTKLPKRVTFHFSQYLSETAFAILENARLGNSIYPLNEHEVQRRRDHFMTAYGKTELLDTLIGAAKEKYGVSGGVMVEWMKYVSVEMKTLKGVLKSDRERYKKLCPNYGSIPGDEENKEK